MRKLCMALAVLLSSAACAIVFAQEYPLKPVRIITGGVGSASDILARRLGTHLSQVWGQYIVVDNRGGAGLTIGTGAAVRAAPDGYTLLLSDRTALVAAPIAYKVAPYNVSSDLAPITLISRLPSLVVVHPSMQVKTLQNLIDLARKNPGKLTYAGAGPVTGIHIAGELFKQMSGVDLTLIQYKGGNASVLAVIGGEVNLTISGVLTTMPHVIAGRLKALAITSSKRSATAPGIPTVAESGVPGYESDMWNGLLAPARTSRDIITKVNRDTVAVLRSAELRKALFDQGAEGIEGAPDEFARFIVSETARMKKVIDAAGIRLEQ